jgi:hypothetical protein
VDGLSCGAFHLGGAAIADRGVGAVGVGEAFDVGVQISPGLVSGGVNAVRHTFGFERVEEALHGGIIPAIAFASHGRRDVSRSQGLTISLGGIQGGFNQWSQHPDSGGYDEATQALFGSVCTEKNAFAGTPAGLAK